MPEKTIVVIADDHPGYAKALTDILSSLPDVGLVHVAVTGQEALELIRLHKPGLAILDLHMPQLSGLQVLEAIRPENPGLRILIISFNDNVTYVQHALDLGADGYLDKGAELEEILIAVKTVLKGHSHIGYSILPNLLKRRESRDFQLSVSELRVLELTAQGYTVKETAEKICACVRTVSRLRESIKLKTGCKTMTGAVLYRATAPN